ncbi:MAG: NapC/NirT family cytochrome c [Calditrichia bacterium]
MRHKLAHFYNPISMVGFILVGFSSFLIIFFTLIDYFVRQESPYMGIVTFIILPVFLIIGLILVPWGAYLDRKRKIAEEPYPILNFNDPKHQWWFTFFASTGIIILMIISYVSYEAFEFSESVTFCGETCHEVMTPEFVAYNNSPHARVKCVECHVGSGAGWYVKSKLSGAYQVYSTIANAYSKPIETPIRNLRPAQATCEQCHWPKFFYTDRVVNYQYYTRESQEYGYVTLRMKIGGGKSQYGESEGIHWHMNINNDVYYIATDEKRQTIPWVKMVDPEGNETIYQNSEEPLEGNPEDYEIRKMDCIDCHNRPSHQYRSPREIVNFLMASGRVPHDIPEIRVVAADAMIEEYHSMQGAVDTIRHAILTYYQENYEDRFEEFRPKLEQAIINILDEYQKNFFPEMKVRWSEYPNNIAHLIFPGCFRCHDNKHESEDGKTISMDCNSCHVIIAQGKEKDNVVYNNEGMEFVHPVDIDEAWKYSICSDCHTGE